MPCTQCMSPYTVFRKEHGCSNCGYGFCEKCLQHKWTLPAISPKPVSVCGSCYGMLSGKASQAQQPKDRSDEDWPPPSLRHLYPVRPKNVTHASSGGGTRVQAHQNRMQIPQQSYKDDFDLEEIQERVAKLKQVPIEEVKNPGIVFQQAASPSSRPLNNLATSEDEVKGLIEAYSNLPSTQYEWSKGKSDAEIAQLEERLAALKGVPVEEVRKPRLMVVNDDTDDDVSLDEDAQELIRQAENESKKTEHCYKNEAMEEDDVSVSSSVLKKIVKEAEDTPSVDSRVNPFMPNFADTMKQVRLQAEEAERQAMDFIRQSQALGPSSSPSEPPTPRPTDANYVPEDPKNTDNSPKKSPDSSKKKSGLFSRFFKSSKSQDKE